MSELWVVVAESSRARIFAADSPVGGLREVETLSHPEGRLHEQDLQADRPGRTFDRGGQGRHAKEPEVSARHQSVTHFAEQIAARLEYGRTRGEYRRLTVVAAPEFLGVLREKLTTATHELIESEIDKNLVRMNGDEIRAHLPERLYSTL